MKWWVYGGKSLEFCDLAMLGLYEADTGSEAIRVCLSDKHRVIDRFATPILAAEPATLVAIQHGNGRWWTGTCWGAQEARKEYVEGDLPDELVVSNPHLLPAVLDDGRPIPMLRLDGLCYYRESDLEPVARVEDVTP